MKRHFSLLMLGIVLCILSVLPVWALDSDLTAEEVRFLKTLPVLRVAADDHFAPLSRWNEETHRYEGIAIDLFQELSRRLGLRFEYLHNPGLSWKQKEELFQIHQIDVVVPMGRTPEQREGLFASDFYQTFYTAVALKAWDHPLTDTRSLAAWRVGIVDGASILPLVKALVPGSQLTVVRNSRDLYQALREGQIDFALQNLLVFREERYSQELFDLKAVRTLTDWPLHYSFYFAKNPENATLISLLNRFWATIDLEPLLARYETGEEDLILRYTEQKRRQDFLLIGLAGAGAGLLFLGILLWNQRRHKASDARFRALAEASFGGIAIHKNGLILECNQGLSDMTGYTRDELIGMDGLLLTAPGDREIAGHHIRTGVGVAYEIEGVKKDGTRYPLLVRGKSVPYQGRPLRVTEFVDLTDQKNAEKATRRAMKQYDTLVAKLPVGVYILRAKVDGAVGFDYVSPPMAAIIGTSAARLLEDFTSGKNLVHPDDVEAFSSLIQHCLSARIPFEWEGRFVHGPEVRWVQISSTPDLQENGDVLWHGLLVDITERHQANEQIRALLEEKDLILREVHHRIKNNMSTISGLLTLQAATLTDPASVAALEDAKGRVWSMMVLYDKLYLSADNQAVSLETYLPALVDQVLSNFPNLGAVTYSTQADPVVIDARTLSSLGIIVNELLTNVMKYAFTGRPRGRIWVTAHRTSQGVSLAVEDDGSGLPADFEALRSTGFGLGLVDMLVKHLKGTFSILPGLGSRFVLEIPLPRGSTGS